MYGQDLYGTFLYGTGSVAPDDPVNPYLPDLARYLPPYYRGARGMIAILGTAAAELGSLRYALDDLLRQIFVATATWGLAAWEYELGIPTEPNKPLERRREVIRAKIQSAGTTTKQMIIDTAAAFSGGEVDVIEYPAEHRFVVQFIGVKGIPPNMAGFIAMLEEIKPAHLAYSFKYTYTTWDMISDLTWAQASTKTWAELRVYEGA